MKTWRKKILHRHNSGTITLNGEIMAAAGLGDAAEVEIAVEAGRLTIRPIKSGVLMTVAGIDCFTWQDVAYVASQQWEAERAAAEGGSGENGGDVAAGGGVESAQEAPESLF